VTTAPASGGGLLPSRPLAAQAHALRAAAAFIERTGLPGLSVSAGDDGITIIVPRSAGPAASRAGAVTYLAALTGAPRPQRSEHRSLAWISATGRIAGHDACILTTFDHGEQESS
jgi:hypothetical protein